MSARVLIVGGGIGGLTAAIGLQRAGLDVHVYERAPELHAAGAGISIMWNALTVLEGFGVAQAVREAGQGVARFAVKSTRRTLFSSSLSDLVGPEGSIVGIHRGALQRVLADAVDRPRLHLGDGGASYEQTPEGVTLILASGDRVEGDLLIGADGIHSAVRAQLQGDRPPRYAGYTCWRGVASPEVVAHLDPGEMFETWGPGGARFGGVHIGEGRFYWFAPVNTPPGGTDAPGQVHADLRRRYAEWPDWVLQVIEGTPEDAILRNDIVDRPFDKRWGEGRVTLLGDAAHSMTPNMGQGACQAIEDAHVLTACLGADPSAVALRRYERVRRSRARAFVQRSWWFGRMGQLENPLLRWVRDTGALLSTQLTPTFLMRWSMRRNLRLPGS